MAPLVHLLQHRPGCLVVHKPPGVPFHATEGHPGLLQLIRNQQGEEHFPYKGPIFPVHRLDFICSGPLVLATTSEAAGELVARFRQREVEKFYVALSDRRPSKKMGSVVGHMEKGRRGSWKLARTSRPVAPTADEEPSGVQPSSKRSPAVTRFVSVAVAGAAAEAERPVGNRVDHEDEGAPAGQLQEESGAAMQQEVGQEQQQQQQQQQQGQRPALRAFLLKPETGRTHQLRVAMKALGSPVLGDERYAQKEAAALEDRGYLHCAALRFTLQGRPVQVVCPPADGRHFQTDSFQQLFSEWFPAGMEEDLGPWFADNKLLRSKLHAGESGAAGVVAAAGVDAAGIEAVLEEFEW